MVCIPKCIRSILVLACAATLAACVPQTDTTPAPVLAPAGVAKIQPVAEHCEVTTFDGHDACAESHQHHGKGGSSSLAPVPPFPSGCAVTAKAGPDGYLGSRKEQEAAYQADVRAFSICTGYQEKLDKRMLADETEHAWRERDPEGYKADLRARAIVDELSRRSAKRTMNAIDDERAAEEKARSDATAKQGHATHAVAPPRSSTAGGSGTCHNNYGGPSARHGQFICSNRGEALACQCSGGSCGLISTGSIICTQAGAVIN